LLTRKHRKVIDEFINEEREKDGIKREFNDLIKAVRKRILHSKQEKKLPIEDKKEDH